MNFFRRSVDKIIASLLRHVDSLEQHASDKLAEARKHIAQQEKFKDLEAAAAAEFERASRVSAKLKELLN